MAEIVITEKNFESEVIQSDKPVLVDFWADWCGPCRMLAPVIDEISQEYAEEIKVGKINVDEQLWLAQKFHVASIPTVMLFKNGQVADTMVGFRPKAQIEKMFR